jgi:hypothetical protein
MQQGQEHEHPKRGHDNRDHDKAIEIIVNGREKTVDTKVLTFDQLVALAFDNPPTGEFICFTITFRRGHGNRPDGTVPEGDSVKVKDGMIFNVTATDKS